MTSTQQLDEWCESHKVPGFAGVFSANTLPVVHRPDDFCCIVNHSPDDSPTGGTHWLACRIRGDVAWWFDSFGLDIDSPIEDVVMGGGVDPPTHFKAWLKRCGVRKVTVNHEDLQSVGSEVCGLYACFFCAHGEPPWPGFSPKHQDANDALIQRLVVVPHPGAGARPRIK